MLCQFRRVPGGRRHAWAGAAKRQQHRIFELRELAWEVLQKTRETRLGRPGLRLSGSSEPELSELELRTPLLRTRAHWGSPLAHSHSEAGSRRPPSKRDLGLALSLVLSDPAPARTRILFQPQRQDREDPNTDQLKGALQLSLFLTVCFSLESAEGPVDLQRQQLKAHLEQAMGRCLHGDHVKVRSHRFKIPLAGPERNKERLKLGSLCRLPIFRGAGRSGRASRSLGRPKHARTGGNQPEGGLDSMSSSRWLGMLMSWLPQREATHFNL